MGKNAASGSDKTRAGMRQPAYRRILEQLRLRISRGDYAVGDKLPTDEMLMSEFGVCRYTARAAIQPLVDDDLVRRYRGRGSFVVATPETSSQWALASLDDLIDYSFAHTVRVETGGAVAARDFPAAATAMGRVGPSLHRLLVVREDKTAPYTCSEIFLPLDPVRRVPAPSLTGQLQGQVVRLLERHGKLRVHRARQVALAEAASGEIARLLQVAEGTPLLVLERSYATREGRVIEYARVYCRPDRYRQTVEFRRHRGRDGKPPSRGH
jgi:GntR family transcriptional regulator